VVAGVGGVVVASGSAAVVVAAGEVVSVAVGELRVGASFREGGVCEEHVARLVGLAGHWPPIVVRRGDGLVIDGAHRVAAAGRLGLERLDAWFFDGGEDEALIEFVRRNVYHGLPLTLRERKRAASRVLVAESGWSDRRIAELCAISPKTVARLRGRPSEDFPQVDGSVRVGRDNRVRPVHAASVRSRVAEAIREQPEASLRSIASSVGVSPETVRLVRMNMREVDEPPVVPVLPARPVVVWGQDAALVSCEQGDDFVGWFERTAVSEADCWLRVSTVPLSRIYEIADEARRRCEVWGQFARSLEARSTRAK